MNGRARGWWRTERWGAHLVGVLLAIGFLVLLFWRSVFVVIGPGEVGVLFDLLVGGHQARQGLR